MVNEKIFEVREKELLKKKNLNDLEEEANIHVKNGEYQKAIGTYKRALSLSPNKELIQSKLIMLYFRIGEDDEALRASSNLINKNKKKSSRVRLESKIRRDWQYLKKELKKPFIIPEGALKENIEKKRAKYSECEEQYLLWYLNHTPNVNEHKIITKLLHESNAKRMYEQKSIVSYRIFCEDESSIHFQLSKKDWGFAINVHRDIIVHKCAIYDSECLTLLSKFHIFLNKTMGKAFLIPRQELEFQGHLGKLFGSNYKDRRFRERSKKRIKY